MNVRGSSLQPMRRINRVHLVGIGGAGMSGIAEVLVNLGFEVSGSDLADSSTTRHLMKLGATIYQAHERANIKGADVLVVSSAIGPESTATMSPWRRFWEPESTKCTSGSSRDTTRWWIVSPWPRRWAR